MKSKHILIALLLLITAACSNKKQITQAPVIAAQHTSAVLPPRAFKEQMTAHPGILIDVRTPGEHKKGAIEGAQLMDIFSDNFDTELAKLDRSQTYYVYCGSGGRSAEAFEKMEKLGFKSVYDLEGGYSAWKQAGF